MHERAGYDATNRRSKYFSQSIRDIWIKKTDGIDWIQSTPSVYLVQANE
jgi:hypothetical protein